MTQTKEIHNALLRLSCIGKTRFHYDPLGQISGDGEIHYLAEVNGWFFIVWEDSGTRAMIVNPITRFSLDELEELGADEAWTVVRVPAMLAEGIQFREIRDTELAKAYRRMEKQTQHEAQVLSCTSG